MKKVQLTSGEVQNVTDRYFQQLLDKGIAIEYKEEKSEPETKEEKTAPKRATKKRK